MAKKNNFFDVLVKTINDVQQKNKSNPREETVDPNVFDLIKSKVRQLDQDIQNKRVEKGKNPVSILDLIKGQVEAARQQNRQDPNVPTAPDSIFDKLIKKVESKSTRVASEGIRRIVDQYNLDISNISRQQIQSIQQQYDQALRQLNAQFAQAIHDLTQR